MAEKPQGFPGPIFVTKPLAPPLEEYTRRLQDVWASGWFANGGACHVELERRLGEHLGAPNLSLFNNGTIALLTACKALELKGEVITTPFTFPATPHVLALNQIEPVFADIDPVRLTIDPARIEALITPRTTAIMGVHVYGMPCDVEGIQSIADRHGLKVIYDGAHAFGTTIGGRPISQFGDATMYSFHATKLFHTGEGGALALADPDVKRRVDLLKNFGIKNETEVAMAGLNGKMSEIQAALGLVVLDHLEAERRAREKVAGVYDRRLSVLPGVTCFALPAEVRSSLQYYVLRIDAANAGLDRDALYEGLKAFNVFARRYFYPLCSSYEFYKDYASSAPANLPVAHRVTTEVLALPFFGALNESGAEQVCDMIEHIFRTR